MKRLMKTLQDKTFKVVKLTKTEFELDNGDTYPIPFELDKDITIEEFQKLLESSKDIMLKLLKTIGE